MKLRTNAAIGRWLAWCGGALLCSLARASAQSEPVRVEPPASLAPVWKALCERSANWPGAPEAVPPAAPELERWNELPRIERDLWLEACARAEVAAQDRRTALFVFASNGERGELAGFCAVAERAFERGDASADAGTERGVQQWLARDPALLGSLAAAVAGATPELRCATHLGVARGAGDRALEYLTNRLGVADAEDRLILGLAGALARVPAEGPPKRLLERARAGLRSDDAGLRREAALVLGRVEDADAAFELAALLDARVHSDRHAAAWALTQITGIAIAPRTRLWIEWLEAEREYWDDEGEDLVAGIARMNRAQQADALRELAQHPWRRAEIARALAPLLVAEDPKIARLTGFVLADLGGTAALAALRAAARDDAELVSGPLQEVLQRIEPPPSAPRRKKYVGARDSSRRASDGR